MYLLHTVYICTYRSYRPNRHYQCVWMLWCNMSFKSCLKTVYCWERENKNLYQLNNVNKKFCCCCCCVVTATVVVVLLLLLLLLTVTHVTHVTHQPTTQQTNLMRECVMRNIILCKMIINIYDNASLYTCKCITLLMNCRERSCELVKMGEWNTSTT